jgi:transcriptional regulator with XRE-family HTH domain
VCRTSKQVERKFAKRKTPGLTQAEVAKKLRRYQSTIANIESGERRIDVVEFWTLGKRLDLTLVG